MRQEKNCKKIQGKRNGWAKEMSKRRKEKEANKPLKEGKKF